jgi:hypothetical protein
MGNVRRIGVSLLATSVLVLSNSGVVNALPAARSYTDETYGDVFLGGEYIELGLSKLGSFGTTEYIPETEDQVPLPEGFFGTAERQNIGMSTNPAGFGEEPDLRMDFFMPGTPEERWSVGYVSGEDTFRGSNSLLNPIDLEDEDVVPSDEIADNTVTDLSSGSTLAARSVGSLNDTLQVTQNISFEKSQKFFKNVVTLKNISGAAIDEVRFMRSFDPDNTVDQGADYTTHNYVTKTHADGDGAAMVVADTQIPDADPLDPVYLVNESWSPIFFYSSDERARVYSWGFSNNDVYAPEVYDDAPSKGFEIVDDIAIGITFDIGTLAANAETTLTYYTSLDNRDIEEVIEEIAAEDGPIDTDEDNISDEVEDAGPNEGDANGDGTPDSQQTNVSSVPNTVAGGTAYASLELTGDCNVITELAINTEATVANDGAYNYPLGLADFASACTTPGGSSTVKIYYDKVYDTSNWVIRKFLNGAYSNVPGAVLGTATVGSTQVTTLTYTVTDGGDLDDDGLVNGVIVDPAGPAVLAVTSPDTGIESLNVLATVSPILVGTGLLVASLQKRRSSHDA